MLLVVALVFGACVPRPEPVPDVLEQYFFYLPLVIRCDSPPRFGVQDEHVAHYEEYADISRVVITVEWAEGIEERLPWITPYWPTMASIRGGTPDEYKLWPGVVCSPPAGEYYDEFADFVLEVAETGVMAIEVWNEPNMSTTSYPFIGCWGTSYAAGAAYGDLVRVVYDAVKSEYPDVEIVIGSLAFSYSDFVAGMLASATGHYDAVSFHCYVPHPGGSFATCGGYAEWLATKTSAPLAMSETAVLSYQPCDVDYAGRQVEWWNYLMDSDFVDWFAWYTIGGNGWPEACPTDLTWDGPETPVYLQYLEDGSFWGGGM